MNAAHAKQNSNAKGPPIFHRTLSILPGNFDTSADVLKQLKVAGVHDSIILAMVRAS